MAAVVPGAVARVVPVREGAGSGMCCEVRAKPLLLDGAGTARNSRAVGVQRDDVPAPYVVAVVAAAAWTRGPIRRTRPVEVIEVRVPRAVVIAEHRSADRLDPSPCGVVHRGEVRGRRAVVLDVPQRKHGGEPSAHQQVGGCALAAARVGSGPTVVTGVVRITCDVAGRGDHRVGRSLSGAEGQCDERRRGDRRQSARRPRHGAALRARTAAPLGDAADSVHASEWLPVEETTRYAARPLTVDALKLSSAVKPVVPSVDAAARGKLIAPRTRSFASVVAIDGVAAVVDEVLP